MANKYSTYELKPYVSQFVDPGSVAIAETLRGRWDKNKAEHDKLQQLANATMVGKFDQRHKDAAIDDIKNKFDTTIKTNNYENADFVVSDAVNGFIGNEALKVSAQSYQWNEKAREKAFELRAQGKNVLFDKVTAKNEDGTIKRDQLGQPVWVDPFDSHSSYDVDPETGETSVNVYEPQMQEQLDYNGEMENLLKNIGSDPYLLERYNLTNEDLNGYLIYGKTNEENVDNITKLLLDNYLTSDAGIQQNRYFTQQAINPLTGEHYTAQESFDKILTQMQNVAEKQKTVEFQYKDDKAYWEYIKNSQKEGNDTPSANIISPSVSAGVRPGFDPYTPIDYMANSSGVIQDDDGGYLGLYKRTWFDDQGNFLFPNVKGDKQSFYDIINNYDDMDQFLADYQDDFLNKRDSAKGQHTQEIEEDWLKKNEAAWVANIMMKNKEAYFATNPDGTRVFKNDKEFLQMVANSMEGIKDQERVARTVSNAYSTYMTEQIHNGTYNKHAWIIGKDGGGLTDTKEEFIKNAALNFRTHGLDMFRTGSNESAVGFENTQRAIKNALENKDNLSVSGFMPAGNKPGTYWMTLRVPTDKDAGNMAFEVQFEIQSDDHVSQVFSESHRVADNLSSGNFDAVETISMGHDYDENGLIQNTKLATIDYIYDHKADKMVPRATVKFYNKADLDQNGMPKKDENGVINVTPYGEESYQGNWILDELFKADMESLANTNHYTSYANWHQASKYSSKGLTLFE